MVMPQDIKQWIEQGLEDARVEIDGDGRHFNAVIVSPAFEGKNLVQQHQLVYAVLGDKMKAEIHALSMRTLTPAEWNSGHQYSGHEYSGHE
jgi:acid stress-induced BolA-like protein IbaG/YrbA